MTLCQRCASRPATFRYRQSLNGRSVGMEVCAQCASAMRSPWARGALADEALVNAYRRKALPLDALTEETRQVLENAAQRAIAWGYDELASEFVLLALVDSKTNAGETLRSAGLESKRLEQEIERLLPRKTALQATKATMAPHLKRAMQHAHQEAHRQGCRYLSPDHLLLGILKEEGSPGALLLQRLGLVPRAIRLGQPEPSAPTRGHAPGDDSALVRYGCDLTELARLEQLTPVIGRDREIARVIHVLGRTTRNNPVLFGEPGVGKTAIVEGLAQRIVTGDVPEGLRDKKIFSLDLARMRTDTKDRDAFAERLAGLVDEVKAQRGEIILFLDDLHTMVDAGHARGALDAASSLKAALEQGELQCIGATTLDAYRRHVEQDTALAPRFQGLLISEPTAVESIVILRGLRDRLEAHHHVRLSDLALIMAVELSDRYVTDRFLPYKAIDLVDEAAAMVRLEYHSPGEELARLEAAAAEIDKDLSAAVAGEQFEEAGRLCDHLRAVRRKLEARRKRIASDRTADAPEVCPEMIARILSKWTGIPSTRLAFEECARLLEMEELLRKRIIGQEEAVRAVSEAVRLSRTGLKDPNRPIASLLFVGPTGVGKTETAKILAEFLFEDEHALVRLDLGASGEKPSVARLIGGPQGHGQAGELTEAVRRRPHTVLLLEGVEKASSEVFNLLLQILDDGQLTDGQGRVVDFTNTFLLLTTDAGAAAIASREDPDFEARGRATLQALRGIFAPEFLRRIDEIVVFHPLDPDQQRPILDSLLEPIRRKLHGQGLNMDLAEAAKEYVIEAGTAHEGGVQALRRAVKRLIEGPIDKVLLKEQDLHGALLKVDLSAGGGLDVRIQRPTATVAWKG